jgi:hypothetical protein
VARREPRDPGTTRGDPTRVRARQELDPTATPQVDRAAADTWTGCHLGKTAGSKALMTRDGPSQSSAWLSLRVAHCPPRARGASTTREAETHERFLRGTTQPNETQSLRTPAWWRHSVR